MFPHTDILKISHRYVSAYVSCKKHQSQRLEPCGVGKDNSFDIEQYRDFEALFGVSTERCATVGGAKMQRSHGWGMAPAK